MHGEYNFFVKTLSIWDFQLLYHNLAHSDFYYFPGPVLSNLGIMSHLIFITTLQRKYYYPCSRNVEVKAQRD